VIHVADVKVHTIGHILDGKCKDWYVFVQTFGNQGDYLILEETDDIYAVPTFRHFGR